MAAGDRTIKIKFDGTARGLIRAAELAAHEIDKVDRKVKRAGRAAATSVGEGMFSGVKDALQGLPAQVKGAAIVAAVAIGVAMAPALGAALTAGVLLAVGGGVLAAGIIAAAKSPQVAAAWAKFGERAKSAFADFGKPFEEPVARAASTFAASLERMAPTLKDMGKSIAPIIDKLAPALASMAEKMLPGIQKALEESKPLFDKLAEHLPKIGKAFSDFFENIGGGSEGAKVFLEIFFRNIEFWVPKLGSFLGGLSTAFLKVFEAIRFLVRRGLEFLGMFIGGAAKAFGWIPGIGPKLQAANEEFKNFAKKVNAALDSIDDETVIIDVKIRGLSKKGIRVAGLTGAGGFTEKAHGGPVLAGRSYLVGERGPELFTPDRSGRITPNHQLGAGVNIGQLIVRAFSDNFRLQQVLDELAWRGVH